MLSRLLRRLQGRPADPPTPSPAAAPAAVSIGSTSQVDTGDVAADPAPHLADHEVRSLFLAQLLDLPAGAVAPPGLAADVLEQLDVRAERMDVARLPRLPAIVPQIMAALRRDDGDALALAGLLERDPTLAGDVLRIANSAHYRRGGAVRSLVQAVGAIGAEGVRYAVLTGVTRPILQADPARQGARLGERLTAHCEARTWLCGTAAPGGAAPAEAQLASVIAATGTASLLWMLPRGLLAQAAPDPVFAPGVFALAAGLSARAAAHWHLDDALCRAIAALGAPETAASALERVLVRSDRLAMLSALGLAAEACDGPDAGADDPGRSLSAAVAP